MKAAARRISKAVMVGEKERAIVLAAREHFLRNGFAGTSMDPIAKSARVSVKTIYSHFANKDELFSKVMVATCTDHLLSSELPPDSELAKRFAWFRDATQRGLMEAGQEYLQHLLSAEQLALYRVVTRDADRFPDLGWHYHRNAARGRTDILVAYFRNVAQRKSWTKRDSTQDAALYEALLRAGIYEEVLHGLVAANSETINIHARSASKTMWKLLTTSGE